jgi:hypothetical protein
MKMVRWMRSMNITSDMAYLAAAASIVLSIVAWNVRRHEGDEAGAERFGIFVGLWAPTLAIAGRALEEQETKIKVEL